jgi:hypothetical protein
LKSGYSFHTTSREANGAWIAGEGTTVWVAPGVIDQPDMTSYGSHCFAKARAEALKRLRAKSSRTANAPIKLPWLRSNANGQSLAFDADIANVLTMDEARRIARNSITGSGRANAMGRPDVR